MSINARIALKRFRTNSGIPGDGKWENMSRGIIEFLKNYY